MASSIEMTDAEQLEKVKAALGVTGLYQDETLQIYIDEVKEYLLSAGVSSEIIATSEVIGVLARGVSDLWNYGAGNAQLSLYFYQRASQLVYKSMIPEPVEEVGE